MLGVPALVSRTGYTGEDGCELILPAASAAAVWDTLFTAGSKLGTQAAGLGCRDTLRLEAAMPLYGHELTEEIDPFQAQLDFAVHTDGRSFPGCEAMLARRERADLPVRVGLEMTGKRPAREGYPIVAGGQPVGWVSSGTFSPTLERPIAMGYVPRQFAAIGTQVAIDIRGKQEPALVVEMPFYRRAK